MNHRLIIVIQMAPFGISHRETLREHLPQSAGSHIPQHLIHIPDLFPALLIDSPRKGRKGIGTGTALTLLRLIRHTADADLPAFSCRRQHFHIGREGCTR